MNVLEGNITITMDQLLHIDGLSRLTCVGPGLLFQEESIWEVKF